MKEFLISEKYRLEIRWDKVKYTDDGVVSLVGCYFTGPVLKEALKLNDEDHMSLDFGTQYMTFVGNYFIADFKWKGVNYVDDKNQIHFTKANITSRYPENIPTLGDKDYIVVDTADHDTDNIMVEDVVENKKLSQKTTTVKAPLSYKTYLLKEDGSLYNFKGE